MNRNIQAKAEKDIQNKLESAPLRHSQLAMSAAKRMPRARKKERVGRGCLSPPASNAGE